MAIKGSEKRVQYFLNQHTGLDPAAPGFDFNDAAIRLDPSDAMFVDVIHSDVRDSALSKALGLQRPCGHVDFYPNGGKHQPGCDTSDVIGGNNRKHLVMMRFWEFDLQYISSTEIKIVGRWL